MRINEAFMTLTLSPLEQCADVLEMTLLAHMMVYLCNTVVHFNLYAWHQCSRLKCMRTCVACTKWKGYALILTLVRTSFYLWCSRSGASRENAHERTCPKCIELHFFVSLCATRGEYCSHHKCARHHCKGVRVLENFKCAEHDTALTCTLETHTQTSSFYRTFTFGTYVFRFTLRCAWLTWPVIEPECAFSPW